MATLILDPRLDSLSRNEFHERFRECWDGVDVMPPMPNTEHQRFVNDLTYACSYVIDRDRGDSCYPGANLSDRVTGWEKNYRCPDVLVYLAANPAVDHGTHWVGGPDFLVEIISDGEEPHAKLAFYAQVKTREVLIVERAPWALELFRLKRGKLASVGRCTPSSGEVASTVLGLTFRLTAGKSRPMIDVTQPATGTAWKI